MCLLLRFLYFSQGSKRSFPRRHRPCKWNLHSEVCTGTRGRRFPFAGTEFHRCSCHGHPKKQVSTAWHSSLPVALKNLPVARSCPGLCANEHLGFVQAPVVANSPHIKVFCKRQADSHPCDFSQKVEYQMELQYSSTAGFDDVIVLFMF